MNEKSDMSAELISSEIPKLKRPFINRTKMDPAENFQEITSIRSRFSKVLKFYEFYGN